MRYICIDLKSFYASVECVERGLDPLDTNLVVADSTRTEKTICLAVTPALKAVGVSGRPRLFEVLQRVDTINRRRLKSTDNRRFSGSSYLASELKKNSSLKFDIIVAPPQMARYISISTEIYKIYLKYVAPEDIHVYSIDEVFIDATPYLSSYKCTAHELAMRMIRDVLKKIGITATAGIGTNMYLAKIAMDIVAKKNLADKDGVHIAELDETSYRAILWEHLPLTDFWRIGKGIVKKLATLKIYTMGDLARFSEYNEDKLYEVFGVNAELLIDHAWGTEPCTIADIKAYEPKSRSISQGQVLSRPYTSANARLICREMADVLALDLHRKGLLCDQIVITIGYDSSFIPNESNISTEKDRYGKITPTPSHGSINIGKLTSSSRRIIDAALELYEMIVDKRLLVRRMYIVANHAVSREIADPPLLQYTLFDDVDRLEEERISDETFTAKENELQSAIMLIKDRYGKNAILKGMNFLSGATAIERNRQVGGHKA